MKPPYTIWIAIGLLNDLGDLQIMLFSHQINTCNVHQIFKYTIF